MALALTPIAGESLLRPCLCRLPWRQEPPCWWSWSFFGLAEEVCLVEKDCFLLDISAEGELIDLFFPPEFFSSFLVCLFPLKHLKSISRVLEKDSSIVFTSALMAFSMAFFQEFRLWARAFNLARTEGFRPFKKHQIMISSFGVASGSNFWRTACKCSRWAAQLRISSC